jgi:4a-hydroxytetrahydrobiopterin dehydratase
MAEPLGPEQRAAALPPLGETGWMAVEGRDAIRKILKFRNFSEAWGAMAQIALAAEALNHHPEWSNVYNVLDITLTTHDCNGLSALDLALAARIDRIAAAATVVRDHGAPVLSLCQERAAGRR